MARALRGSRECALPTAAAVVVNDDTRATPSRRVLDALLAIARDRAKATVVVATGTHRLSEQRRRDHTAALGLGRFARVIWHDADDPGRTRDAIRRTGGCLAVGSVEPHWFAGWTGAHKTATVGVAGREWIEANHARALSPDAGPCVRIGNPVYQGVVRELDWLADIPSGAVDMVLGDNRSSVLAFGGALGETLDAALPAAHAHFVKTHETPLDRLVAMVEPPLDHALYQALKGLVNSASAVRDGGAVILVAACPDGVGIDHFMGPLRAGDSIATMRADIAERGYRLGDHKAVRQRYLTEVRRLRLSLVSRGVSDADAHACGFVPFTNVDDAVAHARRVSPGAREFILHDAAQRVLLLSPQPDHDPHHS